MPISTPRRTAALPFAAFAELAGKLRSGLGAQASTAALQQAGYRAGEALYREFADEVAGGEPSALPRDRFWEDLARYFDRRGWGRLRESRVHPGMGLLTAYDWVEATERAAPGDSGPEGSGCPFSTGMFARILGEAAGGPVAVLQVACPTRGDETCQFLFGHQDAVSRSHGLLADGIPLDRALERV